LTNFSGSYILFIAGQRKREVGKGPEL